MSEFTVERQGESTVIASLTSAAKRINPRLIKNMTLIGLGLQAHVKTRHLSGQSLKTRTGTGRRSIFHKVRQSGAIIEVSVGADLRKAAYMRLQERGGTVRPKRHQFLAIPLTAARTAKGVARFTPLQVRDDPGSFGYVGTFFAQQMIFGSKDDGSIVPLFALKRQVTIKAVGYLAKTLVEKSRWIETTAGEKLEQTILG